MSPNDKAELMPTRPKSFAYRVRGISEGLDTDEVTSLLEQALGVSDLEVKSLAISPIRG